MDESMGVIILEPVHDFFSKIFKVYKNFLSREGKKVVKVITFFLATF